VYPIIPRYQHFISEYANNVHYLEEAFVARLFFYYGIWFVTPRKSTPEKAHLQKIQLENATESSFKRIFFFSFLFLFFFS
jgi:hypothetical protein